MDSNINYAPIFEGEDEFPVEPNLLENITQVRRELAVDMMRFGYYVDGIVVSKFLETDLTINLEKLEVAIIVTVDMLESNSKEDDITIKLRGLEDYYTIRGIKGDEKREREERTFLLTFISSVASNLSKNDTLTVKFVL